jgi:hypothetical protein
MIQSQFKQPLPGKEQLKLAWNYVDGLTFGFSLKHYSVVTLFGHLGIQNECPDESPTKSRAMIAVDLWDKDNKRIPGSLVTRNLNRMEHYMDVVIHNQLVLEPGDYQIKVVAYKRHFDPNFEFPIHIKDPQYSGVWLRIEPEY